MEFQIETQGNYDFIDITDQVAGQFKSSDVKEGIVHIFAKHTTVAITLMEYEEGILEDIKEALERIAPQGADYKHHEKWGDGNGAAHIKSAIIGPETTVPISGGELDLGSWQSIVLVDFDLKPRTRTVSVKVVSES